VHVLEGSFENQSRPCLLLLHGFPKLSFSWRKVMPALAAAGYHVIAPDQPAMVAPLAGMAIMTRPQFLPAAQSGGATRRAGLGARLIARSMR